MGIPITETSCAKCESVICAVKPEDMKQLLEIAAAGGSNSNRVMGKLIRKDGVTKQGWCAAHTLEGFRCPECESWNTYRDSPRFN